jgi:hypothetical protein
MPLITPSRQSAESPRNLRFTSSHVVVSDAKELLRVDLSAGIAFGKDL